MDKKTWDLLKENFTEFEHIGSKYYRLREIEENRYELGCILLGPCGDKTYHPQITLQVAEEVTPLKLIDTEVVPNLYLTKDDQPQELQEALDELVADFLQAKDLTID